jgi:hypothetical protein
VLTASLTPLNAAKNTQQKQDPPANKVHLRVKAVQLGSSYATVLNNFGKPSKLNREKIHDETCGPPYTLLRLRYDGMQIDLHGDVKGRNFKVVSIEVRSPRRPLSPVKLGMSEKEVRSLLSSPFQERDESGFHILNYSTKGNDGGAGLYFRDGKLSKVDWTYTLC